jgi:hypothetical protein
MEEGWLEENVFARWELQFNTFWWKEFHEVVHFDLRIKFINSFENWNWNEKFFMHVRGCCCWKYKMRKEETENEIESERKGINLHSI